MQTEEVKILIVDDEPRNLEALEVMLAPLGCVLVHAQSADEALLALLRHNFAAMVLDIRMPGMSGIDLAKLIKQRRRTRDVPILFLTAHMMDDDDVLRGYGAGAVDYLSKPINADILRSKIGVFVDLFRKTQALAELNETLKDEVSKRRTAQEALEQANQELELRVAERTAAVTIAHRAALEDEERLRMAMDVAHIAAWQWDVTSGQVTWSTDPEALFSLPHGSLGADRRLFTMLHPDDTQRVQTAIESAFVTGTYESEYRVLRPDGEVLWITERGRLLHDLHGSSDSMVGISRDITAQRNAEQEREGLLLSEQRARDEAERQSRLKDEFLATLSHELRTPMNAVLGWLSMLANGQADDPALAMTVITRNARAQAKLIEDLLEMHTLTSGKARLEIAPIDIRVAVNAAVQTLSPAAEAKGVLVDVEIEKGLPELQADAARMQQILWNLLHNGVKFTPAGGRVGLTVSRADNLVRIVVHDTGQGIAPEFLPYVFERFRQADSSPTRRTWGLGIGLSIVKHLVELHGGTIEVSSAGLGHGSSFAVELPLRPGGNMSSDSAEGARRSAELV